MKRVKLWTLVHIIPIFAQHCNKCAVLILILIIGEIGWGDQEEHRNFLLPTQFVCKLKTTPKNQIYYFFKWHIYCRKCIMSCKKAQGRKFKTSLSLLLYHCQYFGIPSSIILSIYLSIHLSIYVSSHLSLEDTLPIIIMWLFSFSI